MVRCLALSLALIVGLAGCAGFIVGGAAASISVAHDRRAAGTVVEDQAIEFKIYSEIDQDKGLVGQSHINVTSYNNAVLLSGEIPSPEAKQSVEGIASNTDEVKQVYNELVIAAPSSLANRNADAWITTKVKSALFTIQHIPDFDPSRVKVVTERGVVYLFGLLTKVEADAVIEVVRQVGGVQQVVTLFEEI